MPRVTTIKTNFTAGEISPRLLSRVDVAKYANGAKTMRNFYSLVHGGAKSRHGTQIRGSAKYSDKTARLIPFIFSRTQAFVLEFGETYIRFYSNDGIVTYATQAITNITQANPAVVTYTGADTYANGDRVLIREVAGMTQVNNREFVVAGLNAGANTFQLSGLNSTGYAAYSTGGTIAEIYEIASPYDDSDLVDLHYVQGADTMFLAHPGYPMRKLVRYGNTNWKLSIIVFDVPPSDEIGDRPATTCTLSATTGVGVTATAAAAAFEAADVGRYIESGAGRAEIVGYTSTTVVTIDIDDAFESVSLASGAWKITVSALTTMTPSVATPVGAGCTLTAAAATFKNNAQVNHVGKFIEINGGLVEIVGFTSNLVVSGIIRTILTGTAAAPSSAWALRENVWNSVDGYPRAVTLFEQRLLAGGSVTYPNTVWGSKSGEYFNFADGIDDADGFAFALASDQVNLIEHLASTRVALPLTFGGEFSLTGGVEKPLSPTSVQARLQTSYGAAVVRPVRVANEVIYIQRGARKVRALGYRVETDAFNAPDISVLSEHITESGIIEMAFAQEPDQVVWMVRNDGHLVSMSIDRDQDAIGFGGHQTDGLFESVAVIPNATYNTDQLWVLVARTINGATVRYVESFEDGVETDCAITGAVTEHTIVSAVWAAGVVTVTHTAHGYGTLDLIRITTINLDAYSGEHIITVTGANTYTYALASDPGTPPVSATAAKAVTVWSGLSHLEGENVAIVADGYVAPGKTVAAGAITLDLAAYRVEIGLHFNGELVTLPPEVGTGQGVAQGNAISIHEIIVRLHKSKGGSINGQPLPARRFSISPVLNQPIDEFTGDKRVENLGWGRTGSGDSPGTVTITRDQPLPMQVLGVITRLTVND